MEIQHHVFQNILEVLVWICILYSAICGIFYVEIFRVLKLDKRTKYPFVEFMKAMFGFVFYMLISLVPMLVLCMFYRSKYAPLAQLFWFLGYALRNRLTQHRNER